MNRRPDTVTFHPIAATAYAGTLFVLAMIWSHPLWLALLLSLTAICFVSLPKSAAGKMALLSALPLAVVFGLVNALFSPSGATPLAIGPLHLRLEPLVFGVAMGLKVTLAVAILCLLGELADTDEMFSFFSRFAPKSSLLAALSILMIPRMARDLERTRTALSMRGARFDYGRLPARVRASRPLFHALLISSLEGAWDIAAALHCRGFDSGKRTSFGAKGMEARDVTLVAVSIVALALSLAGHYSGCGEYHFYPSLDLTLHTPDSLLTCSALFILSAGFLLTRRQAR